MVVENPNTYHGKWSVAGVPHKGWSCVEMDDLGSPTCTCEMCEIATVRYVHVMRHPEYPLELRCGCVCAGRMEEDKKGAKEREGRMRNRENRRASWPDRKAWSISGKGNHSISIAGYDTTVFKKGGGWRVVINIHSSASKKFLLRTYPTIRDAKLAAFDEIVDTEFSKALR